MKDIDSRLQDAERVRPLRKLSVDFTKRTMELARARAGQSVPARLASSLRSISMKVYKVKHAGILVGVVLLLLTGSAYATNGFGFLNALFRDEHSLPNGDRIVQVDTKDCEFVDAVTVTQKRSDHASYYYKVKKDSPLTNEQITQMVQGKCDWDKFAAQTPNLTAELEALNPANKDHMVGGYVDSEIIELTPTSVKLRLEVPIGSQNGLQIRPTMFTLPVDPQVLVAYGSQRLQLQDLKPGDHIAYSYRASGEAWAHSETQAPDQIDPSEVAVVAIYKNPASVTAAIDFDKYKSKDFERVVPCSKDKNPSGYCTLAELNQK